MSRLMTMMTEKKVLMVDDEPVILMVLTSVFQNNGYTTFSSTDGHEALQIVQKENIRVVFTDLRMPSMHGMELCRRIKQIQPQTFIFAVSAFVRAYAPEEFQEAGFHSFFSKPFEPSDLLEACADAFEQLDRLDTASPSPTPTHNP